MSELTTAQRDVAYALIDLLENRQRLQKRGKFDLMFPATDDLDHLGPDGEVLYFARDKYAKHLEFFEAGAKYRERCAMAANRVGKALRNGTPVATPSGWMPIETLRPGDHVIAGDGTVTTVRAVYPQGEVDLYRLTFDRGETIDCCGDHLWKILPPAHRYPQRHSHGQWEQNPGYGEWAVMPTRAILSAWGAAPKPRQRCVMPTSATWVLPAKDLPLHPYLMGVLLGDGGMTGETVTVTTADQEMVKFVRAVLPENADIRSRPSDKYGYSIVRMSGKINPVIAELKAFGIMGKRSEDKYVPGDYLLSDESDRLDLLRGLMDTDGTISKTGTPQFCSTSKALADAVAHLVITLGGTARVKQRQTRNNGKAGLPSWIVSMRIDQCPFRLSRKAERWKPLHNTMHRVLRSIEVADRGHATCIEVDHPDRTFVTEHGIVTHNTFGMGGYELTAHLTGRYPDWWQGRRFSLPIKAWAAGKTRETTRDILQATLMGELVKLDDGRKTFDGTGLIPAEDIGAMVFRSGGSDLLDTVKVRHTGGGWSTLGFKSFEQGRGAFEGTAQHVILLDEEPPLDVYGECVIRTATVNGIVMLTFTPLEGISETVMQFLAVEDEGNRE